MWSAGIIFYTLVCRQLPFQNQDRKATFHMIKEKQPDMENTAFRRHSRETKDLILKMLTKNPDRRITPEQALRHKYFVKNGLANQPKMKQAPVLAQVPNGMKIDENS